MIFGDVLISTVEKLLNRQNSVYLGYPYHCEQTTYGKAHAELCLVCTYTFVILALFKIYHTRFAHVVISKSSSITNLYIPATFSIAFHLYLYVSGRYEVLYLKRSNVSKNVKCQFYVHFTSGISIQMQIRQSLTRSTLKR